MQSLDKNLRINKKLIEFLSWKIANHKVISYIQSVTGGGVENDSAPIEHSWSDCTGRGSRQYKHIPVLKCGCTGTTIAARAVWISWLLLPQNRLPIFSVLFYSVILFYDCKFWGFEVYFENEDDLRGLVILLSSKQGLREKILRENFWFIYAVRQTAVHQSRLYRGNYNVNLSRICYVW